MLALQRGLHATAEAGAALTCGRFLLDPAAARRAGLPGLPGLPGLRGLADLADLACSPYEISPYEILAGAFLVAAAAAGAFVVRTPGAQGRRGLAGFDVRQDWREASKWRGQPLACCLSPAMGMPSPR